MPPSVLDLVSSFEFAANKSLEIVFAAGRTGDSPTYFADPKRAHGWLNCCATGSLGDMARTVWECQTTKK